VILGAFLHDIGHLVGKDKNLEDMVTDGVIIGTQDHDKVGENFLKDLGRLFNFIINYLTYNNSHFHIVSFFMDE
jgi:metal-dependent HD superfamily phosphatase/phosphodiesterase